MCPDNETDLDFLKFTGVANTVAGLSCRRGEQSNKGLKKTRMVLVLVAPSAEVSLYLGCGPGGVRL